MGKNKREGIKLPKKVLGFKLSKGSRKDLGKLLRLIEGPEARGIAISAASVVFGYLAEKMTERKGVVGRLSRKAAPAATPN